MKVIVLLNAGAGKRKVGDDDFVRSVRQALEQAGVEADVRPTPGDRLADAARFAAESAAADRVDAIVAAGGDGTVSAVAGALAGTGVPLGVIPAGTLNHFAKDLGLPLALADAARVIAANHVRAVDVAEVNGRVFINNSSIGLYPHMVSQRERQQERLGRGKWFAMLVASASVFRRYPTVQVVLDLGDAALRRTTPIVFVGNNVYQVDGLSLGGRTAIDRGELCVYFTRRTGRLGLLWLAARAMVGRLKQADDFDAVCRKAITIETRKKTLRVSLDGETARMMPPLRYRVRRGALRVLVAAPAGEAVAGG